MMMISSSYYVLTTLSVATLALAESLAFKSKAGENVEVAYTANRGFTEMSVTYRPEDILATEAEVMLETKSSEGCWQRAPEKQRNKKNGKLVWRLSVVPCLQYSVRLLVEKEDCVEELRLREQLGPVSQDQIIEANYRPLPPGQATLSATEAGNIVLNFTAAPCADHYELYYESEDGEYGSKNFSQGMTEDIIYNMKLNTSYTLTLSSNLGQEWSNVELTWPENPQATSVREEAIECSEIQNICLPSPEPIVRSEGVGSSSSSTLVSLVTLSLSLSLALLGLSSNQY